MVPCGGPFSGESLPGAHPARYFSINYPDFSPRFTLSWRSPPSRPHCTAHFPYKARCIIKQYLCIQQLQLLFVLYLTNNIGPTSVGVNTFITIVLLTLITNCDGGAPLATQNTHFCLDCESLTPTRGATQQSVDSKIVTVFSIAPEGWGPKEGGNATSPLHSRGSPTKGTKSEVKTYARGHHDAPSISKYGSLVQPDPQIAALR